MPISVSDLSPVRQKLKAFVTPNAEDYIVSETVDIATRPIPAFGTPHPDSKNYPDHLFCFAQPSIDEQGRLYRFFYAAPREAQDVYNWEHSVADIGGTKFSAVTRTYVNLRSGYIPLTPIMGTTMPDTPADLFTEEFILAAREEKRITNQELDSIFVVEQLTYVKRVTIYDLGVREATGLGNQNYTVLYYRGELIDGVAVEDLFADPTLGFWGAKPNGTFMDGKQISENWFMVTNRTFIDREPVYRKSASMLMPNEYFCPQALSTETVTVVTTSGEPADPSPADGQEVTVEKSGVRQTTHTTTQTGDPEPLTGTDFDERTGTTLLVTREVVPISEVATATIDSDGNLVTYDPINACFATKVTRGIVSTTMRTYYDVVNYEWPPVLQYIHLETWTAKNNRGSVTYPDYIVKKGFSGPQIATVQQWWQKSAYSPSTPIQLIPESMEFQSPLFSIRIPPCLHDSYTFSCVIGTEDPEWESQSYSRTFDATNYTDWPDSITWEAVQPYRGGYLVSSYTLDKPA
jgi:hypothetical protein